MSFLNDVARVKKFSKPFRIIGNFFPVHNVQEGDYWYLQKIIAQEKLLAYSNSIRDPRAIAPELLKEGKGRKIFRTGFDKGEAVFKSFRFDTLSKRLFKYRFAAWDEAASLILAKERKLPVPNLLGYLINKNSFLVNCDCAIIENIENAIHPVEIFKKESEALELDNVLERCKTLMLAIYEASCNHIDLHGTSFMLDLNNACNDKVIDFQFAVFHDEPSQFIFSHQLAHFVRASRKYLPEELLDSWAEELLKDISMKRFDRNMEVFLTEKSKKVPSSSQRMSLKP